MAERRFKHHPEDMWWVGEARCISEDPDLFFPVGTTPPALEQIARAKAVCFRCPVQEACLEWALSTCQDAGVWGGLDEEERREIRRARRRTAAGGSLVAVG